MNWPDMAKRKNEFLSKGITSRAVPNTIKFDFGTEGAEAVSNAVLIEIKIIL